MPASYLPHLFMLKLPEIMLALGLIGTVGAFIAAARRSVPVNRRASLIMVVLAAILPVALAMVTRPALYNGLRHFVFVVPPFAALGGLAVGWLAEQRARHGKAALAALAGRRSSPASSLPVSDMVRLHPYEYTSFNLFAGGVRAAQDKYMLDYWGLAFKQAADELRARLAAGAERSAARPALGGGDLRSAVVGAESSSGRNSKPPSTSKTADFAMALGTFYCRHLQAADHGHDRARRRRLCPRL